jgi:hypothetical protein
LTITQKGIAISCSSNDRTAESTPDGPCIDISTPNWIDYVVPPNEFLHFEIARVLICGSEETHKLL